MENPNRRGEQATRPNPLSEAISQELATHTTRESLGEAIDTYELRYFDTNFGVSVQRFADTVAEANKLVWFNDPVPTSADTAFVRGAMLGLNATLRQMSDEISTKVLSANFGPSVEPEPGDTDESIDLRICGVVLNQMDQLAEQINVLSPQHQELLKTASSRIYNSADVQHRDRFESGMMYAMWTAVRAANR